MLFFIITYTILSWTMCLLVISCVSYSVFFFAFATVAQKLFLNLRSLILVMIFNIVLGGEGEQQHVFKSTAVLFLNFSCKTQIICYIT